MRNYYLKNLFENRKTLRGIIQLLMIFFIIFLFSGCGDNLFEGVSDDKSYEAKLEDAKIAIDDEEYAEARDILLKLKEDHPNNKEVLKYLSNAYAGLAGIDTFSLLEIIDELDENGNSGSIDMIGLVLGDAEGSISSEEVGESLANLEAALENLQLIENPDDDQIIQMGILGMSHMTLTIAEVVMDDLGLDDVELTEDGLSELYPDDSADFSDIEVPVESLSNDLGLINDAIDELNAISDSGNDLAEDFEEFQEDIDSDGNGQISDENLEDFINNFE